MNRERISIEFWVLGWGRDGDRQDRLFYKILQPPLLDFFVNGLSGKSCGRVRGSCVDVTNEIRLPKRIMAKVG